MDVSSEYVKMCEKAEEIQVGHLSHQDDIYTGKVLFNTYHTYGEGSTWLYCQQSSFSTAPQWEDFIWLPRQDQLQEMLQPCGFSTFLVYFPEFASKAVRNEQITSLEQLWLAFVMSKKYNKIWDGNSWVKCER